MYYHVFKIFLQFLVISSYSCCNSTYYDFSSLSLTNHIHCWKWINTVRFCTRSPLGGCPNANDKQTIQTKNDHTANHRMPLKCWKSFSLEAVLILHKILSSLPPCCSPCNDLVHACHLPVRYAQESQDIYGFILSYNDVMTKSLWLNSDSPTVNLVPLPI